jgi:hypothetical protein
MASFQLPVDSPRVGDDCADGYWNGCNVELGYYDKLGTGDILCTVGKTIPSGQNEKTNPNRESHDVSE